MKKLLIIATLAIVLVGFGFHKHYHPEQPVPTSFESMSCEDLVETYNEFALLYKISSIRLKEVHSDVAKKMWSAVQDFTIQVHDPLLEARTANCKSA